MTIKAFYEYWEDLLDDIPYDVLVATMHMVKYSDEVNVMIADELAFRDTKRPSGTLRFLAINTPKNK